jgi:toxin ParE1/3/4
VSGKYTFSPRARGDLEEIWDYTVERWGQTQAETYMRTIQDAIESVAIAPRRGRSCDEIRRGYFKFAVGSHIVLYRLTKSAVDVVRILHQRMDFNRHLQVPNDQGAQDARPRKVVALTRGG